MGFRDAYWPGGVLAEEYPERCESVKLRTRVTAKTMMLGSLPGLTLFIASVVHQVRFWFAGQHRENVLNVYLNFNANSNI